MTGKKGENPKGDHTQKEKEKNFPRHQKQFRQEMSGLASRQLGKKGEEGSLSKLERILTHLLVKGARWQYRERGENGAMEEGRKKGGGGHGQNSGLKGPGHEGGLVKGRKSKDVLGKSLAQCRS